MKYIGIFLVAIFFSAHSLAGDAKKRRVGDYIADDDRDMRENLNQERQIPSIAQALENIFSFTHYPHNRLYSDYGQQPVASIPFTANLNFPSKVEQNLISLKRNREDWESADISFETIKTQYNIIAPRKSVILIAFLFAVKGEFGVKFQDKEEGHFQILDQEILFETIKELTNTEKDIKGLKKELQSWLNGFTKSFEEKKFPVHIKKGKLTSYNTHRENVYKY